MCTHIEQASTWQVTPPFRRPGPGTPPRSPPSSGCTWQSYDVTSLLQRAHQALDGQLPPITQLQTARGLGDIRIQAIVDGYMSAWEAADAGALTDMLANDATMTMPPRPSWYAGRGAIATFLSRGPMDRSLHWRLRPTRANGQLAFACYLANSRDGRFELHALHVLTLAIDGSIAQINAFLRPLGDHELPALVTERA